MKEKNHDMLTRPTGIRARRKMGNMYIFSILTWQHIRLRTIVTRWRKLNILSVALQWPINDDFQLQSFF